MKSCSVDNCGKPSRSKGWCEMHYNRVRRTGTLENSNLGSLALHGVCSAGHVDPPKDSQGKCRLCAVARVARWREANPEKRKALRRNANYRRRVKAGGCLTLDTDSIFERDNWICQLCRKPVDKSLEFPNPFSKSLEHITPVSAGGPHTEENVCLAHLVCNQKNYARQKELLCL